MRLRTIMFILFCVIAVAPMALFLLLPSSGIYSSELVEAEKRQAAVARILADRLESYHRNLLNVYELIVSDAETVGRSANLTDLEKSLSIINVCVRSKETGRLIRSVVEHGIACQKDLPEPVLAEVQGTIDQNASKAVLSGIVALSEAQNGFLLTRQMGSLIYVGTVSPDYVRNAGNEVKFGINGHAAIVDAQGRAISHPMKDWEDARQNMSSIPAVARMMNRETGVVEFYSPPLDTDVVAAYTYVEGPGWGVMVPQPINEILQRAQAIKYSMLTVLVIGLMLAAALAYGASKILTDPIEQMVTAMHRIGAGELRAYEKITEHSWQPREFNASREGIKAMSMRLQENIDTISRHAYLDGITGLPNRECFRVLAQEEIEKMGLSGRKCALLFLDLDGFKQVNDVYGHRSGDDLLKGFASKLHTHCGNVMKKHARGADNALRILPARLGGDEFVVLLSNMKDVSLTAEFADGLFRRVFGQFKIHNGVSLKVSGSVGGAIFPEMATDFDELLRLADIAMYDAKRSGKGRFCLYKPAPEGEEHNHTPQMQHA